LEFPGFAQKLQIDGGCYMRAPIESDTYSKMETAAREEATLQRLLATPHKSHTPIGKKRVESHGK
jgi:hypothetical protein